MGTALEGAETSTNWTRYRPGQRAGHYESFFQRANHPTRPLAFWIRYTLFSPEGRPEDAIGELWAVYFDGDSSQHVAVKKEVPFARCRFDTSQFAVEIDDAFLAPGASRGSAVSSGHGISWDLRFAGPSRPLFLLPLERYTSKLPRAKGLVGLPMAVYSGSLVVDGKEIAVSDWVGSQNHNWGSRHTDHYAWGQVAGFDSHPDSFLEVATARLRVGPFWTPFLTPIVLRHGGREIALNSWREMFRTKAGFGYFLWTFDAAADEVRLRGRITAPRESFVGLKYYNPPGGTKHCLNTKIASCELEIAHLASGRVQAPEILSTKHRAAFEILTDDYSHGVEIRA